MTSEQPFDLRILVSRYAERSADVVARVKPEPGSLPEVEVTFNAAWQEVTCRECKRTYTCTPEDDYYGRAGEGRPDSATSGTCFRCMLTAGGMNPEVTPVRVIDLTGRGSDPRDLSRKPTGSAS
jgi:hypothetical protein